MTVPPDLARKLALASGKMQDRVTVPIGPSTNNLFVSRGSKRVKSPEYRKWLELVLPQLAFLNSPAAYPCKLVAVIGGKLHHARDLDNTLKVILDAAKLALVIEDDSNKYLRGIDLSYEPGTGPATMTVSFQPLPDEE